MEPQNPSESTPSTLPAPTNMIPIVRVPGVQTAAEKAAAKKRKTQNLMKYLAVGRTLYTVIPLALFFLLVERRAITIDAFPDLLSPVGLFLLLYVLFEILSVLWFNSGKQPAFIALLGRYLAGVVLSVVFMSIVLQFMPWSQNLRETFVGWWTITVPFAELITSGFLFYLTFKNFPKTAAAPEQTQFWQDEEEE